jgi:hypothetical protein
MGAESGIHERFFVDCSFEARSGCFSTEWSPLTVMRGRESVRARRLVRLSRIVTAAEICSVKKIYVNLHEFMSWRANKTRTENKYTYNSLISHNVSLITLE